jgi:mRNA-degrading endonuclease RelE of RelBE toxin-antitoxin system
MIYTVVWTPSALNQLADLWNQASDRQAVTDAADGIDRELRVDAHLRGAPYDHRRYLHISPLVVLYRVDPDDRMVRVIQVRRLP